MSEEIVLQLAYKTDDRPGAEAEEREALQNYVYVRQHRLSYKLHGYLGLTLLSVSILGAAFIPAFWRPNPTLFAFLAGLGVPALAFIWQQLKIVR